MPKITSVSITTTVTIGRLMAKSEMVMGLSLSCLLRFGRPPWPATLSPIPFS
jgi:hypothetical protein